MELYTKKILQLASETYLLGTIKDPDRMATVRSNICGSSLTVYLNLCEGNILEFKQDVKACALGQASASIFAKNAIGQSLKTVVELSDTVKDMLQRGGSAPESPFSDYQYLRPASDFKNRHASILLVLEATKKALAKV